ncbi:hypothetical protein J6590_089494 [Homalodisca vitripennis]|nr:hypothetical protein J6590_089494 [Homalodisca vitripennis]
MGFFGGGGSSNRLAAPVMLTALTGTLLNPNITMKNHQISKESEKEKNNYLPKVGELASHGHQDDQLTVRDTQAAAGNQLVSNQSRSTT